MKTETLNKYRDLYKKHAKAANIIAATFVVLLFISFISVGSAEEQNLDIKVYDTREVYVKSTEDSKIYFEGTMYDNPNLTAFSDFPVKLRIDNTSTESEATELGEMVAKRIKEEIDMHFPGEDYSVKTYVYHTEVNEDGTFNAATSKELVIIDSRE